LQIKLDKIEVFKREMQNMKLSMLSAVKDIGSCYQEKKEVIIEDQIPIIQQVEPTQNHSMLNIVTPKFEEFTHGS
jgi:hypothetical protein